MAISQTVSGPVPTLAAGVAPAETGWSSARNSMSLVGDTLARTVYQPAGGEGVTET